MKIVVLDKENFLADFPKPGFEAEWVEYEHTEPDEIIPRLLNADIVVTHKVALHTYHFSKLPNLKMITTNSTGYNTIDTNAARSYGIAVCNVQDWCTNSVVEHVISFIFTLKRNILPYHLAVKAGEWRKKAKGSYAILYPPFTEIAGSQIGIIGYGQLGKHLRRTAESLGMKVLIAEKRNATSIRPGYTSLMEVITHSDILVLLCPLSGDTYHLIGADELGSMKKSSIVINCGRGGLVDEQALLQALEQNLIAGAAIDVMEEEPPAAGHPLISYQGHNLILSSHVAFASRESIAHNTGQIMSNIEQYLSGAPQNIVN